MTPKKRCAIYTRKSSEEGLDQTFNSLHAQREACEAFVLSQAGEGWSAIRTFYDDGGFSGGSMDRPGLKQLMDDIARGLVDIVVVYKVDRLTRSLADFAKMVELFDSKGVSFVAVTQAFNTTTSMGRLTLNVLLSFAQFEREVTGERIRDKIAASKAKGLRMGGHCPLGYDSKDLRLVVNEAEASTVRMIFERYLELGSVRELALDLARRDVRSKKRVSRRGRETGGARFTSGALHYMLTNPVFRGVNRHKDKLYENAHPAIIDETLWSAVQARLSAGPVTQPPGSKLGEGGLLSGLLYDDQDAKMGIVHTTRGSKRYRYYVSRSKLTGHGEAGSLPRLSAGVLDSFIIEQLQPLLASSWLTAEELSERVRRALRRVVLGADSVRFTLDPDSIDAAAAPSPTIEGQVEICVPLHLKKSRGALIVEAQDGPPAPDRRIDRALVRAVVLAKRWAKQLEAGEFGSIKELAQRNNLCAHYTVRLSSLAWLAPDLTAAIIEGRQPRGLSLATLIAEPMPLDWEAQRALVARAGRI